jgi:hypothetical protein
MGKLSVAKDFSKFPAGRHESDGPYSGEVFRRLLVEELRKGPVTVLLDDTFGYGSSFLEEAFGGLVRACGFTAVDLHKNMTIETSDPSLSKEVWSYVDDALPDAR